MTDERTAAALERIATVIEQWVLERMPDHTVPPLMDEPDSIPWPTQPPADLPPTLPTAPLNSTAPLPPVMAPQYQFTGPSAFCPVHRVPWKTVPAGTSKRTGAPYSAFLACPERGCNEKPQAPR